MNENILDTILKQKRREIVEQAARCPLSSLKEQSASLNAPLHFAEELRNHAHPAIIAEVKRASPSKGVIRADLDPVATAKSFTQAGAACLSILTDEKFFQGKLDFIPEIRRALPTQPLLRKDFICHPYQVWQTRAIGADALLLIVAALSEEEFQQLLDESLKTGLSILIEVHTETELEVALRSLKRVVKHDQQLAHVLLGINNRDLKSFVTDKKVTERIIAHGRKLDSGIFDKLLIVAESGIKTGSDIQSLTASGARAFLIGESLVAVGDPGKNLEILIKESTQQIQKLN